MLSVDIQRKDVICLEARNNPGEAFEAWLMTERQCIRRLDTWDAKHLRSDPIWTQRKKQINSAVSMDPVSNFDRFAQIWIFVDDKPTELISSNWIDVWIRTSHNQKGSICALSRSDDARCKSVEPRDFSDNAVQSERHVANPARERNAKHMAEAKRDGVVSLESENSIHFSRIFSLFNITTIMLINF